MPITPPYLKLPKKNNLDLLRFVFAAMVFLAHAYYLSRATELAWLANISSSGIAVQCFFGVSGFLIFMSYENSTCLEQYFNKRVRRIYPAYFTVVLISALFCVFLSEISWKEYFGSLTFYRYLLANLFFLNFIQPDLPGVFEINHLTAVNGALWTLKIEVMFYLSIPVMVWLMRKIGTWQGLLLIYAFSVLYAHTMGLLIESRGELFAELQRQLPGQLMYFVAGGMLYYYFDRFKTRPNLFLLLAVIGLTVEHVFRLGLFHAISLAIIVIYVAYAIPYLGNFGKYGDFSYGIYILHFPILQSLLSIGLFIISPWLGLTLAIVLTLTFAYVLWHKVEKPALRATSHYVLNIR